MGSRENPPAIVLLACAVNCGCLHVSRAVEINLPAIDANVNYDYFLATPEFVVAENGPSEQLMQSEIGQP